MGLFASRRRVSFDIGRMGQVERANYSVVEILRDPTRHRPRLATSVRAKVTIDWTARENVCAQFRVLVKRIPLTMGMTI